MHPALAQSTEQKPEPQAAVEAPLPDIGTLMREVETNQRAAEQVRKKYTYRAASVVEETDNNGRIKKTESDVREFLFTEGVLVERIVEKNGKPLTDKEKQKEDERVEKQIKEAKERRAKAEREGKTTTSRGNEVLSVARILELGAFSAPRRQLFKGRSTILVDYTGDPHAKSHNTFENVFKDLVGTVWIDEQTRSLVRAEGRFIDNFHIAGGLFVNIQKGLHFSFEQTLINGEVWLPADIRGEGSARIMLFAHIQGRQHSTFSDYRKFQSSATILPGVTEVPDPPPAETLQP